MSAALHRHHVAADVSGCSSEQLDDLDLLTTLVRAACDDGGAHVLDVLSHKFDPQGVSIVALLAESHLSVHTWPEDGCCYLDAFTCGDVDPGVLLRYIVDRLGGDVRFVVVGTPPRLGMAGALDTSL